MWEPQNYNIAASWGPHPVGGYVRGGTLGLHMKSAPSPKGRNPAVYVLTHLNTGHALAEIRGTFTYAATIANEIFELLETWDFTGLDGWKNMRPDLPECFEAIRAREGKNVTRSGTGHMHERAAQILESRGK